MGACHPRLLQQQHWGALQQRSAQCRPATLNYESRCSTHSGTWAPRAFQVQSLYQYTRPTHCALLVVLVFHHLKLRTIAAAVNAWHLVHSLPSVLGSGLSWLPCRLRLARVARLVASLLYCHEQVQYAGITAAATLVGTATLCTHCTPPSPLPPPQPQTPCRPRGGVYLL